MIGHIEHMVAPVGFQLRITGSGRRFDMSVSSSGTGVLELGNTIQVHQPDPFVFKRRDGFIKQCHLVF